MALCEVSTPKYIKTVDSANFPHYFLSLSLFFESFSLLKQVKERNSQGVSPRHAMGEEEVELRKILTEY